MEICGRKMVGSSLAFKAWSSHLIPAPLSHHQPVVVSVLSLVSGEARRKETEALGEGTQ